MILLQTADPVVYADMLAETASANKPYCERHGIDYVQFVGIKRGYHPWQATFNRIVMLEELVRDGYAGWVFYLDADAFIVDPDFDVRAYCSSFGSAMIAAPGGLTGHHWDINSGVFLLDLGAADGRTIVRLWYDDFMQTPDAKLKEAEEWNGFIISDQRRLHEILQRNPELARTALKHAPREVLNDLDASFVCQILRSTGLSVEARIALVREMRAAASS